MIPPKRKFDVQPDTESNFDVQPDTEESPQGNIPVGLDLYPGEKFNEKLGIKSPDVLKAESSERVKKFFGQLDRPTGISEPPHPIRLPVGYGPPKESISARSGPPVTAPSPEETDRFRREVLGEDYTPQNEANLHIGDLAAALPRMMWDNSHSMLGNLPTKAGEAVGKVIDPYEPGFGSNSVTRAAAAIPRAAGKFVEGATTPRNLTIAAAFGGLGELSALTPEEPLLANIAQRVGAHLNAGQEIPPDLKLEITKASRLYIIGKLAKGASRAGQVGLGTVYGAEGANQALNAQNPEEFIAGAAQAALGVAGAVHGLKGMYRNERINPNPRNVTPEPPPEVPKLNQVNPTPPPPDFSSPGGLVAESARRRTVSTPREPSRKFILGPDGKLPIPLGWTVSIGKVPENRDAVTNETQRTITFGSPEIAAKPSVHNQEVAHAILASMQEDSLAKLTESYINQKKNTSKTWIEHGADKMVKEGWAKEDMGIDLGNYYTDPSLVHPKVRALFDIWFPKDKAPVRDRANRGEPLLMQTEGGHIKANPNFVKTEVAPIVPPETPPPIVPSSTTPVGVEPPKKNAPPDRTLRYGRGVNGQVKIVLPDADHKLLLQWAAQSRKSVRTGERAPYDLSEQAKHLATRLGVDASEIPGIAFDYKQKISNAIKELEEDSTFEAPRWDAISEVEPPRTSSNKMPREILDALYGGEEPIVENAPRSEKLKVSKDDTIHNVTELGIITPHGEIRTGKGITHDETFGDEGKLADSSKRYEYDNETNTVYWNSAPSLDDLFKVDDHYSGNSPLGTVTHKYLSGNFGQHGYKTIDMMRLENLRSQDAARATTSRQDNGLPSKWWEFTHAKPNSGVSHTVIDPFDTFSPEELDYLKNNQTLSTIADHANNYIKYMTQIMSDKLSGVTHRPFGYIFNDSIYGSNFRTSYSSLEHTIASNPHTLFSDTGNPIDAIYALLANIEHEMVHSMGISHDNPILFDKALGELRQSIDPGVKNEIADRLLDTFAGSTGEFSPAIQNILSVTNDAIRRRTGIPRTEDRTYAFTGSDAPRTGNPLGGDKSTGEGVPTSAGTPKRRPTTIKVTAPTEDLIRLKQMEGYRYNNDMDAFGNFTMSLPKVGTPVTRLRTAIEAALEEAWQATADKKDMNVAGHARQAARARAVSETMSGEAGARAQLAAMRDKFAKPKLDPLRSKLDQADINDLFDQITISTGEMFAQGGAKHSLMRLLNGEYVEPSGLERLEAALDMGLDDVKSFFHGPEGPAKLPLLDKRRNLVEDGVNIPRALLASFDISFGGRQGITAIHTKAWWQAWGLAVRSAGSEKTFRGLIDEIEARPNAQRTRDAAGKLQPSNYERGRVALTDLTKDLKKREEQSQSTMAEVVPWVRPSNRAHTAFGNKVRADNFDKLYDLLKLNYETALSFGKTGWFERGIFPEKYVTNPLQARTGLSKALRGSNYVEDLNPETNDELVRALGDYVNGSSGRGSLTIHLAKPIRRFFGQTKQGKQRTELSFEGAAVALNAFFFSPRLNMARMQMLNPTHYVFADPFLRKQYVKSMIGLSAYWIAFASAATALGASINWDPDSSDFLKFKFGNTRFDMGGGFQQWLVLYHRMYSGKFVSPTTGKGYQMGQKYGGNTRLDTLMDFAQNKAAPLQNMILKTLDASKAKPFMVGDATLRLFPPLLAQDIISVARDNPNLIPATFLFGATGPGVQTFGKGTSNRLLPNSWFPPQNDLIIPSNAKVK